MHYTSAGDHITDLNNASTLNVGGAASVAVANSQGRATLAIDDRTAVVAHLTSLSVGANTTGAGAVTGNLLITYGASLDATDADAVLIGSAAGASARGSFSVVGGSTLSVGSASAPANMYVGWGYTGDSTINAVGELDALDAAATVNLELNQFVVGYSQFGGGTASGTLRWNQTEVLNANEMTLALGGGASGTIDVPAGGTLQLGTASDPVGLLTIAQNSTGGARTAAALDLSVNNPTFAAYLGGLRLGIAAAGEAEGRLELASNSTLSVGSASAPANMYVGWGYTGDSTINAVGELDALDAAATVNLELNQFVVGYSQFGGGTASGTLRWNQTEVLNANEMTLALGGGASGTIDVPAGGTLQLGTASDPVGLLTIAHNSTGGARTAAALDLSVNNPTFAAYLGGLQLGIAAAGEAEGRLELASNSTLSVGSASAPANMYVGWGYTGDSTINAVGELDALDAAATVNLELNQFVVGYSQFGGGTASGTLRWNQTEAIDANEMTLALGGGASGTIDVPAGGTLQLGTASDPVGLLTIAQNSTGGARTAAALDLSVNNPTFAAYLGGLRLGIAAAGEAEGRLELASNSTLSVGSASAPANMYVGWGYTGDSTINAVGELDALDAAATVNLELNQFVVGYSQFGGGTASGTLRWNQTEVLNANEMTLALGGGASGTIDVPAGGTLQLGTASDPVGLLTIAQNSTGGARTAAALDLSVNNPTFAAYLGGLRLGIAAAGEAEGRLELASNSTLSVGSASAPANMYVGWGYTGDSTINAVGELDALDAAATVNLELNQFVVGYSQFGGGTASGTLRWNQTEVLNANEMTLALGGGASGTIDVPAGGTLQLGTASDPVGLLTIAHNSTGGARTAAALDLSVNNPTFAAYLGGLQLGIAAAGEAEGRLELASNSTLSVGSASAPANMYVGWGYTGNSTINAVGELDALDAAAQVNLDLNQLYIGYNQFGAGTASGIFLVGNGVDLDATTVNIGVGAGATGTVSFVNNFAGSFDAGTVNLAHGTFDLGNNTLNVGPTAGTISTDTLNLSGGALGVQLLGGTDYGQVDVAGAVNLGTGTALDLQLGFAPAAGSSFVIVANDGSDLVEGSFVGLAEGDTFSETFGAESFNLKITYEGGDGNDVALLLV